MCHWRNLLGQVVHIRWTPAIHSAFLNRTRVRDICHDCCIFACMICTKLPAAVALPLVRLEPNALSVAVRRDGLQFPSVRGRERRFDESDIILLFVYRHIRPLTRTGKLAVKTAKEIARYCEKDGGATQFVVVNAEQLDRWRMAIPTATMTVATEVLSDRHAEIPAPAIIIPLTALRRRFRELAAEQERRTDWRVGE
jgi:hypothetical protein